MNTDPTKSNPDIYKVIFENERVRVLEYKDKPGQKTTPHNHPDSVMYTLSEFDRKLILEDKEITVHKTAGEVSWLDAQKHIGENIGSTDTHVVFVELKEPSPKTP
ncbi:cytoplasmic protein [Candidatus Saccharibacteria bacterium CG10_big_fil_rev_8_21_14_0_10_47_8]|nr:MAG: cytoplasmic protein [Candidatus Saccharibacteria bacterium CG10_big_fil_rev_8_21_14_0_10_47_8]